MYIMNYLITGAAGFLGSEIVERLTSDNNLKNKDQLILLGHSEKRADILSRKYNIPVFIGDIKDSSFLETVFKKIPIN